MGLLSKTQSTSGLLNKQPVALPTPQINIPTVANSTPQVAFNSTTPIVPRFATPQVDVPQPTKLSGETTISQGRVSPVDKLLSKLPSGNTKAGFVGDVVRGVVGAPAQIAKEAGLTDEENIVKLDRLAQSLIKSGTDPTRAYEIAGMDIQKNSLDLNQIKNANNFYDKLNVTPIEEKSLKSARLTNSFMTGLANSNFIPAGGFAENIGKNILKIAETKDIGVIATTLKDIGVPKEKIGNLAITLTDISKPEEVNNLIKEAITPKKAGLLTNTPEHILNNPDTLKVVRYDNKGVVEKADVQVIGTGKVAGHDVFVHKNPNGTTGITERSTGLSIGSSNYKTPEKAIADVEKTLRAKEVQGQTLEDIMNKAISKNEAVNKPLDISPITKNETTNIAPNEAKTIIDTNNRNPFTSSEQSSWNNWTHYPRDFNKDYQEMIDQFRSNVEDKLGKNLSPEVEKMIADYNKRAEQYFRDKGQQMLKAPSPFVTGRANYNVGRAQKAMGTYRAKSEAFSEFANTLEKKIGKIAKDSKVATYKALPEADKIRENIKVLNQQKARLNLKRDEFFVAKIDRLIASQEKKLAKLISSGTNSSVKIITDPARIQEVKNSIAEGKNILESKSINGRKMSTDELKQVEKSIENSKAKIGEIKPVSRTSEELAIAKDKLAQRIKDTPKGGKVDLPLEVQENIEMLKAMRDSVENTGFKSLIKYESKTGEFKGELNTNNGTGKFAKQYDTQLREVFQDHNNKYTTEELKNRYEDLKQSYNDLNDQIKFLESKKSTQKFATTPIEVTSVEAKAEEYLSRVPSQYEKDVLSFPDIVERSATEVKDKVNILDYFRTPDRVLEKIGFGKESKEVRKAYEAYIKELPKNLEKITQWSKEVPASSNEKIFKYLDGKGGELNAIELKVAGEIKTWLADWAKRLKLPEDKQITHYITHIFDRELVNKEFDEDLAKIIADKIPSSVYDPFLLSRLGKRGYKEDTWQALDAYVKRATRKANMDSVLDMIQRKTGSSLDLSKIESSQFKYVQRYVNNINMRPSEVDNLIDNTLKNIFGYKYGQRPVTYLTKTLRQMTFRGMLGFNPASALRNLSQGINTYAVLGEKYTTLGYLKLFSKGSITELKDTGVLMDSFIQDRTLSATKKAIEKVDKGLFAMFQTAEYINRGSAYFGAKAKGLAQGMSEKEAIDYGKEIVRKTQFAFGTVDTPVALQNDIVKTLTQFQSYTVKQIEFLTEMAKDKNFIGLLRYAIGGLIFVNTVGKAFNMTADQLIPSFRFDTPPSLKLPVEVAKAILNTPDKYGQPRDLNQKIKDIGTNTIGLIPAGSQIKKTIQGLQLIQKGGAFDKGGNLQYESPQTKEGKIQALLFGKYSGDNAQNYFNKSDNNKKDIEAIQPFYDQVQKLKAEGKNQEALDIYNSLGDKGKTVYKKIKSQENAIKTKQDKADILPIFQSIRKMKEDGDSQGALDSYNALSDDQKKAYQLLKKQLDNNPVSENNNSLSKNLFSALGVESASAMEKLPVQDEKHLVSEALSKVVNQAEHIAPMIDKKYIETLVKQESSNGNDDRNRKLDAGKYGWLVGFTKSTLKEIEDKSNSSQKWLNLKNSISGFDTPEDAIKSALVYSQFLLRDHTKEQQTGKREWKNINATQLYKLYNGNASPKGVESFDSHFNSMNELAVNKNK